MELTSYQLQELLASVKSEKVASTSWRTSELISLNGVYDTLIKEAGRLVDNYVGGLFWDLNSLYEDLKHLPNNVAEFNENTGRYLRVIGLRENGVDGEGAMLTRLHFDYSPCMYRCIYLVEVTAEQEYDGGTYSMELFTVSRGRLQDRLKSLAQQERG